MKSQTWVVCRMLLGLFAVLVMPLHAQTALRSTILLKVAADDAFLYSFRPSLESSDHFELAYLDVSAEKLDLTNTKFTTLSTDLPFLQNGSSLAFVPVIGGDGNITVFCGDCKASAAGAEMWRYVPNSDRTKEGSWSQVSVDAEWNDGRGGAKYLTTGISFTSKIRASDSMPNLYVFGGLCPLANADTDTWQADSEYSNTMLSIDPIGPEPDTVYNINSILSYDPLIAQAGYAIAPLKATFSEDEDGEKSQQQDFVILGGQTRDAFINVSRIAMFSLPQETYNYIDVIPPDNQRTDLAVRADITEIQPRSGHSAVLSDDGKSIIICGGWVGDVLNQAEPQLAILRVGDDYGGEGPWTWTAPSVDSSPLSNVGIYGHGATLLPGNVLMITGGYQIPVADSRTRRQTSNVANTQTFFYNITSNTWVDNYDPASAPQSAGFSQGSDSGPLSTKSQKAGLGAGIGVGALALLGAIGIFVWYRRRQREYKELREKGLNDFAHIAHRVETTPYHSGNVDEQADQAYSFEGQQGWKIKEGRDAHGTALRLDKLSPTRGLRRGLATRPVAYTDGRLPQTSGFIHSIDELEEDEEASLTEKSRLQTEERPKSADRLSLMAGGMNPLGSHPVHAGLPARHKHTDSYNSARSIDWQEEMHPKSAGLSFKNGTSSSSSGGRSSPTKSERTISNLSERSMRSNLSARSTNFPSPMSRNLSVRSSTLPNTPLDPFTDHHQIPIFGLAPTGYYSNRPSTALSEENSERSDSFTTAQSKSSFAALQAEGQALLGGLPENEDHAHSPVIHDEEDEEFEFRRRERSRSFLGNMREVLGRAITRSTSGAQRPASMVQRSSSLSNRLSLALNGGEPVNAKGESKSHSNSPKKRHSGNELMFDALINQRPSSSPPRRSASDASFWKSKRGAKDWGVAAGASESEDVKWQRNSGDDWGSPEDQEKRARQEEDEWDVEGAAGGRDVQMTFTVPKQRLRIVNKTSMMSLETKTDDGDDNEHDQSKMLVPVPERKDDVPGSAVDSDASSESSRGSRVKELVKRFET